MSYLLNNQQKLNDVIFENRNKTYGAYAIRSSYGNTVFKSLLTTCLTSCAFAALAYFLLGKKPVEALAVDGQIRDVEVSTIYNLEKQKPAAPEINRPPLRQDPPRTNASGIGTTVVDTLPAETNSQSINETLPQFVSNSTGTAGSVSVPATDGGTGPDISSSGTTSVNKVEEGFGVDSQPEFEGGLTALYRFVSSRLKYPRPAEEAGKEGTVYVKFVVDEKGKVGGILLQNNLGYGLDDEARRVVSMIPDFKTPAKIKGNPVKVYYQLPIRFRMR